jgi:hypothetical protein
MGTWRKRLRGRAVIIIIFGVAAGFLNGCQQDDEVSRLIEESPFKNDPLENPGDIQIVTCQFYPLEIPGHVDITRWSFWKQYNALAPAGSGAAPDSDGGFPVQQLQLWQKNGFHVAVAPMLSWSDFRQAVLRSGGRALSQSLALIRRPVDIAQFNAYWLERDRSVFIFEGPGSGRALTLPAGDCAFAINCIPDLGGHQAKEFHIKIVPEVHNALEQARINQDESGNFHRVRERPKVTFDQLGLSGTIPRGYYMVIASVPGLIEAGTLGQIFLSRQIEGQNRQMAVVIAPNMQTGARIKSELSNQGLPK